MRHAEEEVEEADEEEEAEEEEGRVWMWMWKEKWMAGMMEERTQEAKSRVYMCLMTGDTDSQHHGTA